MSSKFSPILCTRLFVARLIPIITLLLFVVSTATVGQTNNKNGAPATMSEEKNYKQQVVTDASLNRQAMAMVTCFKILAGVDFNALLDMFTTPNSRKSWNKSSAGIFSEQIDAAAFFDTAFVFAQKGSRGSFTVVAYNMWIDSVVLATCERIEGDLKITELRIVSAGMPSVPNIQDPAHLEKELNRRLVGAAKRDYAKLASSPKNSRAIQKTLTEYRKAMRDALSPEAKKENETIQKAVNQFMEECGKPIPDTKALADLPKEWRALLHPVYLSKRMDESPQSSTSRTKSGVAQEVGAKSIKYLLVLSTSKTPGRWLFVEFRISGQTARVESVSIGSVNPD